MNYYNEFDPAAAQWLRNLIAAGLIPAGDVDERSIEDVRPSDLAGYIQCHFFAGIGGWPEALRLARVPDDTPLWTGSCPCQPYSAAGKGGGSDDPRNLWWAFRWLIDQCRPAAVIGEQVASKAGRGWLAGVRADLEALGYAVGAADLCAAGAGPEAEGWIGYGDGSFTWEPVILGAPHIRQRVFWVADTDGERRDGQSVRIQPGRSHEEGSEAAGSGSDGGMADANGRQCDGFADGQGRLTDGAAPGRVESNGIPERPRPAGRLADTQSERRHGGENTARSRGRGGVEDSCDAGRLADAVRDGAEHAPGRGMGAEATADEADGSVPGERLRPGVESTSGGMADTDDTGPQGRIERRDGTGQRSAWARGVAIECADGKVRRIPESVLQCLADGFPAGVGGLSPREGYPLAQGVEGRVTALKGIGNAIVPQVAAEFITSWREARCHY